MHSGVELFCLVLCPMSDLDKIWVAQISYRYSNLS
jgi:hypothetical protein